MNGLPRIALLTLAALPLAGCDLSSGLSSSPILSGPACEINDLSEGWSKCKNGQILAFLPGSWGNEQLPIVASALYCDFAHPIVHNHGGVSCVFTNSRKPAETPPAK